MSRVCAFFGHRWIYQPTSLSDAVKRLPERWCSRCRLVQRQSRIVIPESRQIIEVVTPSVARDTWLDEPSTDPGPARTPAAPGGGAPQESPE